MKRIYFTLLFTVVVLAVYSQSTTVVISQVFSGGGGTTGTYKRDYIQLFNKTSSTVDISGWSLQYGGATANLGATAANIYTFATTTTIPANSYFLIATGSTGAGGADIPVAQDLQTTNISMTAASGKVALVNNSSALGCGSTATPCTLPNANIVDWVSYGNSGSGEGGTTVNNLTPLTATQGSVRKQEGCTDTDNNNFDFNVVTNPVPSNSSTMYTCSVVLPVELLWFKSFCNENLVNLSWSVTDEEGMEMYEVERSMVGTGIWEKIASIKPLNTPAEKTYTYTDDVAGKGKILYRLKQVEISGLHNYSSTSMVNCITKGSAVSIMHAAGSSFATIRSNELSPKKALIQLFTTNGTKMLQQTGEISVNAPLKIDLHSLINGHYFIVVTYEGERISKKIVRFKS